MWLYMIAAALLVIGLIGGVLTGGIFLIIFIPLGIIALITAIATGALARGAERRASGAESAPAGPAEQPLPHRLPEPERHIPTTPDALVDARRREQ
jgi:predicted lipid-binding transport protein (Tim44 family)